MSETKLAPNLPQWMVDHAHRYIASGGTDGHIYTIKREGVPELAVPSLLLTTTGRKSGEKYITSFSSVIAPVLLSNSLYLICSPLELA